MNESGKCCMRTVIYYPAIPCLASLYTGFLSRLTEWGGNQDLPIVKGMLGEIVMIEKTEELLTVSEVARRLRVDETTVRRWIKLGSLEAITLPHRGKRQSYRIKQSIMETLMK
jgi:excisionase family DNA binding protein